MNKDNAHLFLPLVQALADGKTIQLATNTGWVDLDPYENDEFGDGITFSSDPSYYRVKPEPRTFDVWVCIDPYYDWADGDKRLDEPRVEHIKRWKRITVQEVLK